MREPRARARTRALLAGAALLAAACGSGTDACQAELISVTLPATLERNGAPSVATLAGEVSVGTVGTPAFAALRQLLTGDAGAATSGVIWTVPAFEPEQGWVAVALDAPLAAGEELAVGSAFDGAGWGIFDLPAGTRLAAGLRAGTFAATTVTGTASVLGVAPLRLRLDLQGADGTGATVRIRGEASFSYRAGPPSCT